MFDDHSFRFIIDAKISVLDRNGYIPTYTIPAKDHLLPKVVIVCPVLYLMMIPDPSLPPAAPPCLVTDFLNILQNLPDWQASLLAHLGLSVKIEDPPKTASCKQRKAPSLPCQWWWHQRRPWIFQLRAGCWMDHYVDLYGSVWDPLLVWNWAPFEPDYTAYSQSCSSSITTFNSSKDRYPTALLGHLLYCDNQGLLKCLGFANHCLVSKYNLEGRIIDILHRLPAVKCFYTTMLKVITRWKNCLGDLHWEVQVNCHTPPIIITEIYFTLSRLSRTNS